MRSDRYGIVATLVLAVLLNVIGSGCLGGADKVDFRFNWPVPSRAVVEREKEEAGVTTRTRFLLTLEEGTTPDELHVVMRDFEFLQYGDADLDDPAVRAEIAPLLIATKAIPTIVISRQGEFLRISDWDRKIDEAEASLRQIDPPQDDEAIEHFVSFMKNPATRQQMQATAAKDWDLWVGIWNGQRLRRGEPKEFTSPMNFGWGGQIDGSAKLTYLAEDEESPDVHRIRFENGTKTPEFREAVLLARENQLPPEQRDADTIAAMRATIALCTLTFDAVAIMDPATLRPTSISYTRITKIFSFVRPPEEWEEKRTYTFVWE